MTSSCLEESMCTGTQALVTDDNDVFLFGGEHVYRYSSFPACTSSEARPACVRLTTVCWWPPNKLAGRSQHGEQHGGDDAVLCSDVSSSTGGSLCRLVQDYLPSCSGGSNSSKHVARVQASRWHCHKNADDTCLFMGHPCACILARFNALVMLITR